MRKDIRNILGLKRLAKIVGGFTLIEMAIAILIIGLLITPAFVYFQNIQEQERINTTFERVQFAADQLQVFRGINGHFPCPAPLTNAAPRGTAGFGRANTAFCNPLSAAPPVAPGNCSGGLCVEQSIRTTLADRTVIVGSIPFRDLQLEERDTLDAYGNRLVYAVTRSLTDITTFNDANGGIQIVNELNETQSDPAASTLFVVLSPGENRVGGYTSDGVLTQACGAPAQGLDLENCNPGFSGGAATLNAVYRAAEVSRTPDSSEFDDRITYFNTFNTDLWYRTPGNIENIEDLSPDGVVAGSASPPDNVDLRIQGSRSTPLVDSLRVTSTAPGEGRILVDQICDESAVDTNCFTPADMEMTCPAGQLMVGIVDGGPDCEDDIEIGCPPAGDDTLRVLVGQNADGSPRCVPVPRASCAATTMSECGEAVSLPLAADGVLYPDGGAAVAADGSSNIPAGATRAGYIPRLNNVHIGQCKVQRYRCNNGNWDVVSDQGICPPSANLGNASCRDLLGCGHSGTYTAQAQCTNWGTTTGAGDTSTCSCPGETCSVNRNCPAPLVDMFTETTVVLASPNPVCGPPSVTSNQSTACQCPAPSDGPTRALDLECPLGFNGTNIQPQRFDNDVNSATACQYVNDGSAQNTCVCDTSPFFMVEPADCPNACEEPDPANPTILNFDRDPANGCSVRSLGSTLGQCRSKPFSWIRVGATIGPASGGGLILGGACDCSDFTATNSGTQTRRCTNGSADFNCQCR